MIKYDWDGISIHTTKEDWEQEDLLAQLHAEHLDTEHICIEDECPYWQPEE